MIVMFGMGLTMKPKDFALIFKRPKDILIGCAAQFIIMPALAFGLSKLFGLDVALTAGVVLVGTCPGAIFSVWHNISGAILSGFYRRWKNEK